MTKEEYIQQKQTRQIDLLSSYEFYCNADSTSDKLSYNDFIKYLPQYLNSGASMDKYFRYMDSKFNILSLTDNNGNIKYF